jgi:hypothetical protein
MWLPWQVYRQLWTGGLPHDGGNPMRGPAAPPCHSSIDHPPNPGVVAVAMMMTIVMMLLMTIMLMTDDGDDYNPVQSSIGMMRCMENDGNHGRRMMFRLIIILIIMAIMAIIPIVMLTMMVVMIIIIAHELR